MNGTSRRVEILAPLLVCDADARTILGGAERYLLEFCRLLADLGYEPRVRQPGTKAHWWEEMRVEGLPWGEVEYDTAPDLNLQFYERTASAGKTVYFAPTLPFPRVRPHAVVISHGAYWDTVLRPQAHFAGPHGEEWLRRLRHAVTAADLFVSVDSNTLNWIRATWPGHESRQTCIPNFVDTEAFSPAAETRAGVTILYPRRLDPGRGFAEAKAAAAVLIERYADVEFQFVGSGMEEADEAEARRWTAAHPRCIYHSAPMERMPDIYRGADIVLIPSRANEGTSLSCLEAMACGKAVVCGCVGGLTDLIIDGYNGRLIGVTPESLIAAVADLIDHPDKRRRLGEKARATAEVFSGARWRERWKQALRAIWGEIHGSRE